MRRLALILVCAVCVLGARAAPAAAFNPFGAVCDAAGLASGVVGKACNLLSQGGRILGAGRQILGGHFGSAIKTFLGQAGSAVSSGGRTALSLAAIGAWVLGGARFALHETAKVLSETTTPRLGTSWFSATYWRVAGIAALLTLPFLFAAVVQALVHSDLPLLLRTVLGYLPLAMLAVAIAAPVTMLLLSASDELSGLVSSATGHPGSRALALGGVLATGLSALSGSPFLIFFLGLLTVAGAMTLWMELLMREAAVYVVVLMLPLAFAALAWPARRVWATRAIELLVALILSKFAIVAVLSLGGAAMDQVGHSITAPIVGLVLVMMGAFAPWALLRLVPLAELGAGAVESLRGQGRMVSSRVEAPFGAGLGAEEWASATTAEMRRSAEQAMAPAQEGPSGLASEVGQTEVAAEAGGETEPVDGEPGQPAPDDQEGRPGTQAGGARGPKPDLRLPGLPDMWQADDLSWEPLMLDGDEGWPPRVWPSQNGNEPEDPTDVAGVAPEGMAGLPTPEAWPTEDPGTATDPGPASDRGPAPDPLPAPEATSLGDAPPADPT